MIKIISETDNNLVITLGAKARNTNFSFEGVIIDKPSNLDIVQIKNNQENDIVINHLIRLRRETHVDLMINDYPFEIYINILEGNAEDIKKEK
ncbi:MAG: hypothetical protein AAGF07_05325 [Patescibacteria group bacterium]